MNALELMIPPPVVALLAAAATWGLGRLVPAPSWAFAGHLYVAGFVALAGAAVAAAGMAQFVRSHTTLNPHRPHKASALVSSGIFRITRNPMYLGLLLALAGWALYLGAALSWAGPVLFALYIQRFQIVPEQRVLLARFGDEYARYIARVRPWL